MQGCCWVIGKLCSRDKELEKGDECSFQHCSPTAHSELWEVTLLMGIALCLARPVVTWLSDSLHGAAPHLPCDWFCGFFQPCILLLLISPFFFFQSLYQCSVGPVIIVKDSSLFIIKWRCFSIVLLELVYFSLSTWFTPVNKNQAHKKSRFKVT